MIEGIDPRSRRARNAENQPIGEGHIRARWPDEQVEELRVMHEDHGLGWRKLAKMYNIPAGTIRHWIYLSRRGQVVDHYADV